MQSYTSYPKSLVPALQPKGVPIILRAAPVGAALGQRRALRKEAAADPTIYLSYSFRCTRMRASLNATDSSAEETNSLASRPRVITLTAKDLTPELFEPYGQVVGPTDDGKQFDGADAQLTLDRGTPRFYIMRLPHRGRTFDRITFHRNVTQCLGALFPTEHWYLVVAKPTLDVQQWPDWTRDDLVAFRIPHGVFVKLKEGTWHAGPLFDANSADFYNLELADTNVVDHNTHCYEGQGVVFQVMD